MVNIKTKIVNCIKKSGKTTIPQMQLKLKLDYKTVSSAFNELVKAKVIYLDCGLDFKLVEKPVPPKLDDLRSARTSLERRRLELLRAMREEDNDGDDEDDEDDDDGDDDLF